MKDEPRLSPAFLSEIVPSISNFTSAWSSCRSPYCPTSRCDWALTVLRAPSASRGPSQPPATTNDEGLESIEIFAQLLL